MPHRRADRCGGGGVVPRQQHGLHTLGMKVSDGTGRRLLDGVSDADGTADGVARRRRIRLSGPVTRPTLRAAARLAGTTRSRVTQVGTPDDHGHTVHRTGHAVAGERLEVLHRGDALGPRRQ